MKSNNIVEDHSTEFERLLKYQNALDELVESQIKKGFNKENGFDEATFKIAFIHGWKMYEKLEGQPYDKRR